MGIPSSLRPIGAVAARTTFRRGCLYALLLGIATALLRVRGSRVERLAVVKVMS
jgi:hypothetical protein